MKSQRRTLTITSILFMAAIWLFIGLEKGTDLLQGFDLFVFILIVIFGAIALYSAFHKDKAEKEGLPAEDEMSTYLKYKSGYHAYLYSIYIWLLIFLLRGKFPNIETLLAVGIILSVLIGFIVRVILKWNFNEK